MIKSNDETNENKLIRIQTVISTGGKKIPKSSKRQIIKKITDLNFENDPFTK